MFVILLFQATQKKTYNSLLILLKIDDLQS